MQALFDEPARTLAFGAVCCVLGAAWFARGLDELREAVRPIYRRMGILPQVTSAVEAAGRLTFEIRD